MSLHDLMSSRLWLLFALLSLVVCALVNPGNFGTIDTSRRLQVERWIRLGEPPVTPVDPGGFGVIGRNGVRHAWYGVGQSLVLLPFDALVSAAAIPVLGHFGLDAGRQQQIVELSIAFLMQSVVTAFSLALAYALLLSVGFARFASMAGALALLFGTSYLQYAQSAQENNLLLLLALCALYAIRRWQGGAGVRWAVMAGSACGFAILVRLPSMLETAVFLMFAIAGKPNWKGFLAGYLPPVAAGVFFDRLYHWIRFGELFSTYWSLVSRQARPAGAPVTFPFSYPFWKGFAGTLFSPDKSIFLFDPLLMVLLVVTIWKWSDINNAVRHLILWLTVLLFLYIVFYATYYDFGGDVAWGHRFVTLPVQLLCLFAVPLLLTLSASLPRLLRGAAWATVSASIALQMASTTLAPNVEVLQREMGYDNGVIANRIVNLAQTALHREDRARFAGIPVEWRSLSYFPFQLRFRFPSFAGWAIAGWLALLMCLPCLVFTTLRSVANGRPI